MSWSIYANRYLIVHCYRKEESYVSFFSIVIHFIIVGCIGLMPFHRTGYKFQQYLLSIVNLWAICALNGQRFYAMHR